MDDRKKDSSISSGWYLLGGLVVGAAAGLLLAPKKGSETREDLEALRDRAREKTRNALSRIGSSLPGRVKAAAAVGAAQSGAKELFNESRDTAKEFSGS